ncbi:IS110 family RNA-guided transposase [Senegalimassilia anaerobia]|uniref:IS110 family transposase n=1 Tax=Senegalimassilia anaerobia TaxID=1473216 RepID=UPI0026ED74F8|nr:IS110 family transposase [Senegalimassilia anaerobia]
MIYAGVDIAKADHVIGAVDETGAEAAKPMAFKNSEAGFERCIAWPESVAQTEDDVFVGMEATGHCWMACFAHLTAAGYRVCVVNPMQVHAMRRLKGLSGVKNDRIDSLLIAETLGQGDYDQTRLAADEVQALKQLTRYHQGLKRELATVKTQAICVLDAYFPEYAGLFSDMFGAASLKVLSECPTPSEAARKRASSIAKMPSEGSHGRLGAERAARIKAAARSSVGIRLGEDAASFQIKTMVSQIEFLNATIAKVEREVGMLLERIEPNITTIPGVSTTTGAQIVAEVGDVKRFKNAASIVKYAGLNSGVDESGKFSAEGVPITKQGPPYLRRSLWLAANRARRFDPRLKAFYDKKRREGKPHRVAVTAVARKLCHVVYAVMRDGEPYDPGK